MYQYIAEQAEIISDILEEISEWEDFERDLTEGDPWA